MTGRHTQITLSFLVVGHTKFSPDWCFGLFKRLYRKTKVGSLKDISRVVNESACCNFAQLVTAEDGTNVVPTLNWADFFAPYLKKIVGIKKYHHFRFTADEPGVVYTKFHCDTTESREELLKDNWLPDPSFLPSVIIPKGLSTERQWYLFEKIRQFCPYDDQDLTCPEPTVPKTASRAVTPVLEDEEVSLPPPQITVSRSTGAGDSSALPPTKKARVCSTCKNKGHNSRTCGGRQ